MIALGEGEVHLWRADLAAGDAALEHWRGWLDEAERARADRFHFAEDRRHYIAARGMLRELLGGYLGAGPRAIALRYTPSGKPSVGQPETDLKFNVSHSRAQGLFAFCRGREIGVDVEVGARLGDDLAALARRVFSARETVRWLLRPEEERRDAFLDVWTRKEALLKASGRGIADGLQEIETPAVRGSEPVAAPQGPAGAEERWTLWDLRAFTGCAAALALEGSAPASVRLQSWSQKPAFSPPPPHLPGEAAAFPGKSGPVE